MNSRKVEFLEIVALDVHSAMSFYDSWKLGGAAYFESKFDETVGWIEWNPEMFPQEYRSYRRAIIKNTHFAIFYVIESEVTTVVAVCDLRRSPAALKRLLRGRTGERPQ